MDWLADLISKLNHLFQFVLRGIIYVNLICLGILSIYFTYHFCIRMWEYLHRVAFSHSWRLG